MAVKTKSQGYPHYYLQGPNQEGPFLISRTSLPFLFSPSDTLAPLMFLKKVTVLLSQGIAHFFCLELFLPESYMASFYLSNICSNVIFSKYLTVVFYITHPTPITSYCPFSAFYFPLTLILISYTIYLHFHISLQMNVSPMRQGLLIIIFTPVSPASQKSSVFDEQTNK